MRRKSLLLLAGLSIFWSCSVEQNFTFNSDFSGEINQSIDYSSAQELMEMDSASTESEEMILLPDSVFDEVNKEIEGIKGARLISLKDEDYKLELNVGFDDLGALNKVLISNAKGSDDTNLYCQFKKKGKSMRIEFVVEEPAKENNDSTEGEFEMNPEGLYEMSSYKFSFTFESEVNSTTGTPALTLEDGKTVVVEQSLQKFLSPDFEQVLQVDLK